MDYLNGRLLYQKQVCVDGDDENAYYIPCDVSNALLLNEMIDEVYDAFLEEYQIQQVLGLGTNEIDAFSGFVFSTGEGNVYTPESVNRAIKRIYDDYNKKETEAAAREKREPLLRPHFSCHNLRHTFCTRLCENESNVKVIQSVMGHADFSTTMDIYAECTAEKKNEVFATLNGKIMIK